MSASSLLFLADDHPLQRVDSGTKTALRTAQETYVERIFPSAASLCECVLVDLKVRANVPIELADQPVGALADLPFDDLTRLFAGIGRTAGIPDVSLAAMAEALADRLQLVRAFDDPDGVLDRLIRSKIEGVAAALPRKASDIEQGRNPGDVLDPIYFRLPSTFFIGEDWTTQSAGQSPKRPL